MAQGQGQSTWRSKLLGGTAKQAPVPDKAALLCQLSELVSSELVEALVATGEIAGGAEQEAQLGVTLERYLVAEKLDVGKAHARLVQQAAWRREHLPGGLLAFDEVRRHLVCVCADALHCMHAHSSIYRLLLAFGNMATIVASVAGAHSNALGCGQVVRAGPGAQGPPAAGGPGAQARPRCVGQLPETYTTASMALQCCSVVILCSYCCCGIRAQSGCCAPTGFALSALRRALPGTCFAVMERYITYCIEAGSQLCWSAGSPTDLKMVILVDLEGELEGYP